MTEKLANCTIVAALVLAFTAAVASNPALRQGAGVSGMLQTLAADLVAVADAGSSPAPNAGNDGNSQFLSP